MTNYRQTMADAYEQVKLNTEANDFGLSGTLTDTQLSNLKRVWATKSKKDITPGIKSMIAKLDVPTQVAVKHAKINVISDLIETLEENFSASQIDRLKKEYEVMRGKKISIANANKLSQMFKNIPDSGLVDIFKADIPFLSVMAMTKMIQKNIPRPAGVKLRLEEVEILDEATQNEIEIIESKIDAKKFDSLKKGDTMTITYNSMMSGTTVKKFVVKNKTRSAKYNTDKVKLEIENKPGTSPFYLYKRKDGSVSFAQGDMAATVVAVKEAVLQGRDYKFDGKTVSISKKNFSQVSKDFKNATPGQEKMVVLDPKSQGTISAPVKFTEEDNNEVDEACWDSHKQVGMKTKGGKQVPNCVPKEGAKKLVDSIIKKKMQKKELGEASLYASKEYEPGLISNNVNADMKNIEDAIKRAGGRIKSKEKPTRREPNMSFEIETGNPNAVKAAIKKVDPEFDID